MSETVALDLETSVPETVIGKCCYHNKCVWFCKVMRKHYFAARIALRNHLSAENLRKMGKVSNGRKHRRKLARWLRKAIRNYIHYRLMGASHSEVLEAIFGTNPIKIPSSLAEYIGDVLNTIIENPDKLILEGINTAPPTGWKYLKDDTLTLEPLFLPARYLPRVLYHARRMPRLYTDLVFCSEDKCYPAPEGIWPFRDWTIVAGEALRRDATDYILSEFGALDIVSYLLNTVDDEIAIIVRPGRRFTRVSLFVLVNNPEETVVRVAKLQETVKKLIDQLSVLVASDLETVQKISWIAEKDIDRAIEKTFFSNQ